MKYLFSISILSFALLFVSNHVAAQLVVDEDGCVGEGKKVELQSGTQINYGASIMVNSF